MASDHVNIVITADSVGPTQVGFGTGMIPSFTAAWAERTRTYESYAEVLEDFPTTTSPEAVYAAAYFSQTPRPEQLKIGRFALPPTQKYTLDPLAAVVAGSRYQLTVAGEGVTETDIDHTVAEDLDIDVADSGLLQLDVVAAAATFTRLTGSFLTDGFVVGQEVTFSGFANGGNNVTKTILTVTALVITVTSNAGLVNETGGGDERGIGSIIVLSTNAIRITSHGLTSGDGPFRLSTTGALPTGTAVDTNYWAIVFDANTFALAATRAAALAETPAVDITAGGTGVHTLEFDTNDVLMATLVQSLNDVVGNNFIAAVVAGAGDTDTLTVTADAAGDWFSIEVKDRALMGIVEDNVDPGIATDLAAIALEDKDWRTFIPTFASKAILKAAAAWVEATPQTDMLATTSDSLVCTATSTGSADVADDLKTSGYKRTMLFYHPSPKKACNAAFAGIWLTTAPGSATAKFQQPVGPGAVSPFTATHKTNLKAKNVNWLGLDSGLTFTQNSRASGGQFFDIQRDDDYVETTMRGRVLGSLVQVAKTPLTDPGIQKVANDVRGVLDEVSDPDSGAQIYASYVLEVPRAKDISAADRATRTISGIKWTAVRAGAVENVDPVSGFVAL